MIVWSGGHTGTIGGGRLEYGAIKRAGDLLKEGREQLIERQALGPGLGQCCGGAVTLVYERFDTTRLAEAEGIVCCGPFDTMADPDVNRADFLYAKTKGMKLLCANPDIVVDRGEVREWCAGALAKLYTEMGGESLYFGKPHPPIYDLARRRLAELGKDVPDSRILAIGDSVNDASMLTWAGHSAAPEHCDHYAQGAATEILPGPGVSGVAALLRSVAP